MKIEEQRQAILLRQALNLCRILHCDVESLDELDEEDCAEWVEEARSNLADLTEKGAVLKAEGRHYHCPTCNERHHLPPGLGAIAPLIEK